MKKQFLLSLLTIPFFAYSQSWNITGNTGINPPAHFIGTTDNQSIIFKTNNTEWLRLNTKGRFIVQDINPGAYGWSNNLFFGGGNDVSTGLGNTAFGLASLSLNTTGRYNTAIGANSQRVSTVGTANTTVGVNTMLRNETGNSNTSLGNNALNGFRSGDYNTAIGQGSMVGKGVGDEAISGFNNTAVGQGSIAGIVQGSFNTIMGSRSLGRLRNGSNNIALGYGIAMDTELDKANNNIYIGNNLIPQTTSPNNELNIGNWIYGQDGKIGIGGVSHPDLALKIYGRTQVRSDINSDALAVLNDAENLGDDIDLLFLRYGTYQPNNPSVMTVSGMTTPTKYEAFFNLRANGKLGLGTYNFQTCTDCTDYRLFVKDGIRTEKVKVDIASTNGWADYVFKKDYKLATLEEVEKHINDKGHLPNIPSAEEVVKNGLNLGEMDAKLLEKIEELTLYSIDLNKKNGVLNNQIQQQQKAIDKLSQKIEMLEKTSR